MTFTEETRKYEKAAQKAVRNDLRRSALLGNSVPVRGPDNGVIWLNPEQIFEELRKQEETDKLESAEAK